MGAAPPWGQSLLRSCLASHSFPPPPPLTAARGAPPKRFRTDPSVAVTVPGPNAIGHAMSEMGHASPLIKRGWGREGGRSEARAEQRLAPGGRSPHNPCQYLWALKPGVGSLLRYPVLVADSPQV